MDFFVQSKLVEVQFAATALEHFDNVWYSPAAPSSGTKYELWKYLADAAAWDGSNTEIPPAIQSLSGNRLWWLLLILISWICGW